MLAFDNEWYAIGLSEEFRRGHKRGVRLHGREIVVWRLANGELTALEYRATRAATG